MEFLRPKDVTKKMKISRPLLYQLIKKEMFPKPVKMGPTISVWLSSEVDRIMIAMFNKANEDKIKEIVRDIEASRKTTIQM